MDLDIREKRIGYNSIFIIYGLVLFFLLSACASSKIDRQIKRRSGIIKDSKEIAYSISDNVFTSTILTLREHKVFDIECPGIIWSYYSGTWDLRGDTIYLDYFYNHEPLQMKDKVFVDFDNKKFIFFYETSNGLKEVIREYYGDI